MERSYSAASKEVFTSYGKISRKTNENWITKCDPGNRPASSIVALSWHRDYLDDKGNLSRIPYTGYVCHALFYVGAPFQQRNSVLISRKMEIPFEISPILLYFIHIFIYALFVSMGNKFSK